MVEVQRKKYPLNPTMKWTDAEGRLTAEGFRIIRAIGELIENISIEDGEVRTEMLEAEIIRVSTLFADEVIITNKIKPNAVSELSALFQVGSTGPGGGTIVSGAVPITTLSNTGLLLTLTAFMDRPNLDSGNFGYWSMQLNRNGTQIDTTPQLYYDDNFSYQPVASFIDPTPGADPTYSVTTTLHSGDGDFSITGGVLNVSLLKR
jgi:hypothetical protein